MKKESTKSSVISKLLLIISLLLFVITAVLVAHILLSKDKFEKKVRCTSHDEEIQSYNVNVVTADLTSIYHKSSKSSSARETGKANNLEGYFGHIYNAWNDHTSDLDLNNIKKILDAKLAKMKSESASFTISITKDSVVNMIVVKPGWKRTCQRHAAHFHTKILQGRVFFQTHEMEKPIISKPGDLIFIPKWQPHRVGVAGKKAVYMVDIITPNIYRYNLTEKLDNVKCSHQKLPPLKVPKIVTNEEPVRKLLPPSWTATVLLHPFSDDQGVGPDRNYPFFQLTYGKISYNSDAQEMCIHVKGCTKGEWWFKITGNSTNTSVSTDATTWRVVDLGWRLPTRNWTNPGDVYIGHSPLNWMNDEKRVDWWKRKDHNTSTWSWFDRKINSGVPFRLMFATPPSLVKGERNKLAFFQMYAFSYIVNLKEQFTKPEDLNLNDINDIGLRCGNPDNFSVFNWTNHFSMSAVMIPLDPQHNPYPTQIYYHWKDGQNYTGNPFDRSQSTIFYNDYNSFDYLETIRTDLFGSWDGKEKRNGTGFLLKTSLVDWQTKCELMRDGDHAISQQPPWWPTLGKAEIVAIIRKPKNASDDWTSPLTNSNRTIAIMRITFPPQWPVFPNSTSLWTWYDYTDYIEAVGEARPVLFMSSSKFNLGSNLAQADFHDFKVLSRHMHSRTKLDLENLKKYCNFS